MTSSAAWTQPRSQNPDGVVGDGVGAGHLAEQRERTHGLPRGAEVAEHDVEGGGAER